MLFTLHFHFAGFEAPIFARISVSACFIHWQSSCFAKPQKSFISSVAKCAWSAGHVHYSNPLRWRSGTCLFQRTTEREIVVNLATAVFLRSMSEISEVRSLYPPCHPCRPLSSPACRSRRYDSDQQIHRRRFPSVARLLLSLAKLNALQGDQPAPALSKVQITDKKHMKKTLSKQASKGFQG